MGRYVDRTGMQYGRLRVIERMPDYITPTRKVHQVVWKCECECGNIVCVTVNHLLSGKVKSCGCAKKGVHVKHGDARYKNASRLYGVWSSMIQRCENPKKKSYHRYGGRGIAVCEEWHDFSKFKEWAIATGYDAEAKFGECTLDRIDVDGNYCPENCRWIPMEAQARNRRGNVLVEHNGEKITLAELAETYGLKAGTVRWRYYHGWSVDEIIQSVRKRSMSREDKV